MADHDYNDSPSAMEDDDGGNPFRLPPDDQIFLMREQERKKRAEERDMYKRLKVWEKTTASSRVHRSRRLKDEDIPVPTPGDTRKDAGLQPGAATIGRDPKREKENIIDFVAKKREMFLVQMSLNVKRQEILKLDEKTRMKEQALNKSQQMLEEDVTRFDTFLQANDAKAHKAMKVAEEKTKEKQERMQKIKQMKQQISAIQSEISKNKEQKEECIKYKEFLDKLTPQEWKDKQIDLKKERRRKRREDYVNSRTAKINKRMQGDLDGEDKSLQEELEQRQRRGRRGKKEEEEVTQLQSASEKRKKQIRKRFQGELDRVDAEYHSEDSGEEMPPYFVEPKQLLDIFTAKEESNLFLIQNSQETEQALEEINQKFKDTRQVLDAKAEFLKQGKQALEEQIAEQHKACEELQHKLKHSAEAAAAPARVQPVGIEPQGPPPDDVAPLLKALRGKLRDVYKQCNPEMDSDPPALQMLGAIEATLEELLSQLDEFQTLNDEVVAREEKRKEHVRRDRVRQERQEYNTKKTEERLKNSLLRSQAPVHKKTGKQIMFRSAPLHQQKKVVKEDDGAEEAARLKRIFGIDVRDFPPVDGSPRPMIDQKGATR
mmetsp:Transcript_75871/g.173697  ORF Transcript_75871/g.173697 Transcript_75871/m.173697 type:complete len:602 (+) Transcript_75871:140-1945(+)